MTNTVQKKNTTNYVVVTIKDWNINEFDRVMPIFSGNWTLIKNNNQLSLENLRRLKPKYVFFPHWSWIVAEDILNEFTCVCFHMTDVPYGRGGSPLQNLISLGHKETKLTALKMTNQLDAGAIYLKAPLSLQGSAQEIFERSAQLTFEMIQSIITLEPIPIEQTGEVTTFFRRRPEQSRVQGNETLAELYDLIRMMDADSYPKAFLHHGDLTLTFEQAKLSELDASQEHTINAHVIIKTRKK
ncbi:MAG: methionyl-tRNA formyltransferase [Colwellia sp.]|jgi:methionyl-tRNA formyltransferase